MYIFSSCGLRSLAGKFAGCHIHGNVMRLLHDRHHPNYFVISSICVRLRLFILPTKWSLI